MISAKDIVDEINKRLRDTWTDHEWENGKDVFIKREWFGRLKFITERYESAGWVVKKRAELSSSGVHEFYMNFTNPMSFEQSPPEIRDTGVRLK